MSFVSFVSFVHSFLCRKPHEKAPPETAVLIQSIDIDPYDRISKSSKFTRLRTPHEGSGGKPATSKDFQLFWYEFV